MIRPFQIYQRLAITFATLFIALVLVGGFSILQSNRERDILESLNDQNHDLNTLEDLRAEFLQARLQATIFTSQWRAVGFEIASRSYLVPHATHLATASALSADLSTLDAVNLNALNQYLADYQESFGAVSSSIQQEATIDGADIAGYQIAARNILDELDRLILEANQARDRNLNRLQDSDSTIEQLGLILLAVAFIGGVVLATLLSISIVVPLRRLNRAANLFQQGHFDQRITDSSRDEIGTLSQSLNQVADRVEGLVAGLEQRIAASTRDLQTVIDINTQIVTILDAQRLLQAVVSLTKDRFNLYHAHVYSIDEAHLVLTAGAGAVGRLLVEQGQTIMMDHPQSIVARAARERHPVLVNDTTASPTFLPNRLLPDTRAELAVPLISRGQLLGVIDIQSETVNFFDNQIIRIMEVLATQIANALLNVQLYEEAARISRHEQALGQLTQAIQGANSVDDVLQAAVRELGKALRVPHTAIELQLRSES
ncbi:MAG: GAF domain-containing protein [Anaerolineales bacterium]|nr:GAF domain-containing protein [Anaerolineales bacterium]